MGTSKNSLQVKKIFDKALSDYHQDIFIDTDPLQIPHRYDDAQDQEVTAFMAALFAFGNVRAMMKVLNPLIVEMGRRPSQFLRSSSTRELRELGQKFCYRFYSPLDIAALLLALQKLLNKFESLENAFKECPSKDLLERLSSFRSLIKSYLPDSMGLKFMLPHPEKSASKRLHLFLRWVVRKDEVDLGIWNCLHPKNLIIPLDTHIFQISQFFGLTQRQSPSLAAALEITSVLRSWDPKDPIKYDFALCRLGILGLKEEFMSQNVGYAKADAHSSNL